MCRYRVMVLLCGAALLAFAPVSAQEPDEASRAAEPMPPEAVQAVERPAEPAPAPARPAGDAPPPQRYLSETQIERELVDGLPPPRPADGPEAESPATPAVAKSVPVPPPPPPPPSLSKPVPPLLPPLAKAPAPATAQPAEPPLAKAIAPAAAPVLPPASPPAVPAAPAAFPVPGSGPAAAPVPMPPPAAKAAGAPSPGAVSEPRPSAASALERPQAIETDLARDAEPPPAPRPPIDDSRPRQRYLSDVRLHKEPLGATAPRRARARARGERPFPGPDVAYETHARSDGTIESSAWCYAADPVYRDLGRWVRCGTP